MGLRTETVAVGGEGQTQYLSCEWGAHGLLGQKGYHDISLSFSWVLRRHRQADREVPGIRGWYLAVSRARIPAKLRRRQPV